MTRRRVMLAGSTALTAWAAENKAARGDRVHPRRIPGGGLQPQSAVDEHGNLHLVYYTGDPFKGNLRYVRSSDFGTSFSSPLSVNKAGSAVAAGTIRGAQIALGKAGRVHVAWNGSNEAEAKGPINPDSGKPGAPVLYARLNNAGTDFEPERNLMLHSFGLDGGGTIAADPAGNVYVAWHGIGENEAKTGVGEARRRVWITKSEDEGQSFQAEHQAWAQPTGACGCCGMKIHASRAGEISVFYRSATESVHRDIYLLSSKDRGQTFEGGLLHKWDINACPMSSMDFADNETMLAGAWETGGQIYWARLDGNQSRRIVSAPGDGKGRKHPRLAMNPGGEMLLVWTEGTGWQKGGSFAWQLYDRDGQPTAEKGLVAGIPTWSFAAPVPRPDHGFSILY